ncbi:MAG: EMC3/TMCO1 family protein [Candidatus Nanoarchaeia archaeon]|nr:EMC3/TMCO1 family protein [Candidatus Nanoarchaeia archaeon]
MEYWIMLLQLAAVAFGLSLGVQLIYKFLSGKKSQEAKLEFKELSKRIKTEKEPEELKKIQSRILELNSAMMKGMLIPMIASMLVYAILYPSAGSYFSGFVIYSWDSPVLPIIGNDIGWFLGLVLLQMVFSPILKKVLKVN